MHGCENYQLRKKNDFKNIVLKKKKYTPQIMCVLVQANARI